MSKKDHRIVCIYHAVYHNCKCVCMYVHICIQIENEPSATVDEESLTLMTFSFDLAFI